MRPCAQVDAGVTTAASIKTISESVLEGIAMKPAHIKKLLVAQGGGGGGAAGAKTKHAAAPKAEQADDDDAPVVKKQVKKGRAVLDEIYCKKNPGMVPKVQIYEEGDDIYDAMLNQTNIKENNNKFYVIQIIVDPDANKFWVWNRWGRVGVPGQDKLLPQPGLAQAKAEFTKKFLDKTKNEFAARANFVKHPGKYQLIHMDYADPAEAEAEAAQSSKAAATVKQPVPESILAPEVQQLVKLIFDTDMMKAQMEEVGYDSRKMPLGKLSKDTIRQGYEVLEDISRALESPMSASALREELLELSGRFFTVIPHDFGFSKMVNHVINTPAKLKNKLQMVEALGDIVVHHEVMEGGDAEEVNQNPVDAQFGKLKCGMSVAAPGSEVYKMCEQYLVDTHASTHSSYSLELGNVFVLDREGEAERFKAFEKVGNHQLLWHGSRLTNWTGILSQGLRIAPPEAPVTGYMFDKGVYFADISSKSANYCFATSKSKTGLLLLGEVALGDMQEMTRHDYHAASTMSKAGKQSVKGIGRTQPNPKADVDHDGCKVPLGKPVDTDVKETALLYNEYIVYDVRQVRMKYLLQVNFNFNINTISSW